MQDIERQLEALYYLRDFVLDFRDDLLGNIQAYNNMVLRLKEVGIPIEIAENYESNYYTANIQRLLQMVETLSEVDVKYINSNIYTLELALAGATVGSPIDKVMVFNKGTENIKRKIEDEKEKRCRQAQIITAFKKKIHIEEGLDSVKQRASELSALEEQQQINNKYYLHWLEQNLK